MGTALSGTGLTGVFAGVDTGSGVLCLGRSENAGAHQRVLSGAESRAGLGNGVSTGRQLATVRFWRGEHHQFHHERRVALDHLEPP